MRDILVESDRLLVRRPEDGDGPALERAFCDPATMSYLGSVWTAEQVAETIREWRDDWGVDGRWSGVLVRRDTQESVGTAGLTWGTIPGEPGFELSWFVVPELQGRGFATEISRELLRFAFDELGAERVVVETHPDNPASNRVVEKLGFECLGERSHSYDYLPGFETQVLWALTREDFQGQAARTAGSKLRAPPDNGAISARAARRTEYATPDGRQHAQDRSRGQRAGSAAGREEAPWSPQPPPTSSS